MGLDYLQKLTTHRQHYEIDDLEISYESDRGRIISSPAFRRLQKRTQVFPLELDAAVRSRLTHSLEVAQTSRYIAKKIVAKLHEKGMAKGCNIDRCEDAFISVAEMTSLVHDIGNPPFGHFAESVIQDWITQTGSKIFKKVTKKTQAKKLQKQLLRDLSAFDGNAQSVRVITRLQRLNLSYTQIAAVLKYTRCGAQKRPKRGERGFYLKKKPGFYYSEKDLIHSVQEALQIKPGHRFPITYIMEAADDISYLTADLEDAVDKGLLHLEQVVALIDTHCQEVNKAHGIDQNLLQKMVQKYYSYVQSDDEPYRFNMFLTLLRARLINHLVEYVANSYIKNHKAIFEGSFDKALLQADPNSQESIAVKVLQDISIKYIYNHKTIQNMELQSYRIVRGLLDCFVPLLKLSYAQMQDLRKGGTVSPQIVSRLYNRLPKKQRIVYQSAVDDLKNHDWDQKVVLEWYHRMRLILDYISGMTDDYALSEYESLML